MAAEDEWVMELKKIIRELENVLVSLRLLLRSISEESVRRK